MTEHEGGVLVLVGTPLGNRADLSPRARAAILGADLLLCEDTRSPTRLLGADAVLPRRLSCFVGNEHERVPTLLEALALGQTVVFISEAGMPVWSDPGRGLVEAAVMAGHAVDVVPGPTAATAALAVSGFDATGAVFFGFLPRSGPGREAALERVSHSLGPSILYEAGNRVGATLAALRERLPDAERRRVLVARELTKAHQEILRGNLRELAAEVGDALRGEVTIVVAGRDAASEAPDPARDAARELLEVMLDPTRKPRERAKLIAQLTGLEPRDVYQRLTRTRT